MTTFPTLAFLGAGNMASAMLRGLVAQHICEPSRIYATDVRPESLQGLVSTLGIQGAASNRDACAAADVIVLAVKPQVLESVVTEVADVLSDHKLVVSIVAGVPIARIQRWLGGRGRVIRTMPNTPAMVGAGATAMSAGPGVTEADMDIARRLFEATGTVVRVEERLLDAVTGLSGSGPAFAFVAIEALSDAGVRAGLARDVATRLAAQTLLGAAKMVLETGEHPARLKDMVTSPAGTTIAGVAALDAHGFRHALHAAVEAATARSKELGSL
jgi:pyrroline-5-carboxylate reductase